MSVRADLRADSTILDDLSLALIGNAWERTFRVRGKTLPRGVFDQG